MAHKINLNQSPWKRETLEILACGSMRQPDLTGRNDASETRERRRKTLWVMHEAGLLSVEEDMRKGNLWSITEEGTRLLEEWENRQK